MVEEALRLPPGEQVRFRVRAEDGRFGSSWSVKTAAGEGDVYVSHREGGRWMHVSLHRDGRWHHAVTPAGQELVPGTPRYLGVTRDHDEIAPGWVHAMRITVAVDELRDEWHEGVRSRSVVEVRAHDEYDAINIDIFLGAPGARPIHFAGGLAVRIADMERGDGGLAVVVARPMELDAPVRVAMASQITEALEELQNFGWEGTTRTRLVIFGNDPSGFVREVEVAVDAT